MEPNKNLTAGSTLQIPRSVLDRCPSASAPAIVGSPPASATRERPSEPADFEAANLSREQVIVLRAIGAGKGICAAAREAGVNRSTVYRWQRDPQFLHWLHAWKFQTKDSGRNILLNLIERAARIIERALEKDDVRVAITLLSKLGVLASGEIPGLGAMEGPVLSSVEGPAVSKVEAPAARKVEGSTASSADRPATSRPAFAPPKPPKNLNELHHLINELETKFGDMLPGGRR